MGSGCRFFGSTVGMLSDGSGIGAAVGRTAAAAAAGLVLEIARYSVVAACPN